MATKRYRGSGLSSFLPFWGELAERVVVNGETITKKVDVKTAKHYRMKTYAFKYALERERPDLRMRYENFRFFSSPSNLNGMADTDEVEITWGQQSPMMDKIFNELRAEGILRGESPAVFNQGFEVEREEDKPPEKIKSTEDVLKELGIIQPEDHKG